MSAIAAKQKVLPVESESKTAILGPVAIPELSAKVNHASLHESLQATFGMFDQLSHHLNQSYLELEARIGVLQTELAQSDQEREKEHYAKRILADRLELVLNAMPVAVVLLDGRGAVVNANIMAESLLGVSLRNKKWIDIIGQCFSPQPADGHEVLLQNGKLVNIATQSLTNEPGQIIVITDQTETRRLQQKINHNRKLSEMGKMTASLAHQIRTPLSTATLYADHLASADLSEDRRVRYAGKLKQRLLQLEQQVRDMLIFSKGGVVLESILTVFQLLSVLQSKIEDYSGQQQVCIEFGQDIPVGSVRCNVELLSSIFANLIDNAIEACRAQGIKPQIQVAFNQIKSGFVECSISDNGPGIGNSKPEKLLEPFFTTKSTGTGLGLAVVKTVAEAHGGQFSIRNRSGGGACACITLPLIQNHYDHSVEEQR